MAIRPYMDAVEGIEEVFSGQSDAAMELIILEDLGADAINALADRMIAERFRVLIAIGPEAARFAWNDVNHDETMLRFYTMVLNPETIIAKDELLCGIPLNIPVREQIAEIVHHLPGMKRIGLMFDPSLNQSFFNQSTIAALDFGVEVVPIPVSSTMQLSTVLGAAWKRIDGLWLIPDRTVISESLVRHITKTAIANRIPVVGYNRFFLESGAAMAMVLDYRGIGRQTASMCLERVTGQPCRLMYPVFETVVDKRLLHKMGIDYRAAPATPGGGTSN